MGLIQLTLNQAWRWLSQRRDLHSKNKLSQVLQFQLRLTSCGVLHRSARQMIRGTE